MTFFEEMLERYGLPEEIFGITTRDYESLDALQTGEAAKEGDVSQILGPVPCDPDEIPDAFEVAELAAPHGGHVDPDMPPWGDEGDENWGSRLDFDIGIDDPFMPPRES